MTRGQKAGQTNHERAEREKEAIRQARRDKEQAIQICRTIRDNPEAQDSDRLKAIELLKELTA